MTKMKTFYLVRQTFTFIILASALTATAEQSDVESVDPSAETLPEQSAKIRFIAAPKKLALNIDNKSISWINVLNEQHLVFKRSFKSRIYRGNVILFHAPGENPLHNRLINPLSSQMSDLGWNTFSSNIGFPDFQRKIKTVETIEQNQSSQQDSEQQALSEQKATSNEEPVNPQESDKPEPEPESAINKTEGFFKTDSSFQEYFSLICQETLKLVKITEEPTIILADGEAAYWILDCLKQMSPNTPIVIIEPSVPFFAYQKLDSTLESIDNPIFTLATENNDDYFVELIKQQKLRSTKRRFNQSALINSKINIENTTIAKLITGWVKNINSESQ